MNKNNLTFNVIPAPCPSVAFSEGGKAGIYKNYLYRFQIKSFGKLRILSGMTKSKGFTLIELLVVISIIGILAALALTSYGGAQKQARDTERRSDLGQYRNALETYASANNGFYPITSGNSNAGSSIFANPGVLIPALLGSLINDPVPATYSYYYFGDGSAGITYKLYAVMETGGYWVVCSSGKAGKFAGTLAANSSCDI